jgi:hypothetical protein
VCFTAARGYVHDMKAFAGEVRSSVLSGAHVSWKCAGGAPWCSWLGRTLESQIVNGDAGIRESQRALLGFITADREMFVSSREIQRHKHSLGSPSSAQG